MHESEGFVVGVAQPFEPGDLGAGGDAQGLGHCVGGLDDAQVEHVGPGITGGRAEVVVQRGELDGPADLGVDDLSSDAALAYEHAALHEVLDGAAGGGPGDAEAFGEVHLVLDAAADPDLALLDEFLQAARDLEVQGDGAGAVHLDGTRATVGRRKVGRHVAPSAFQFVMTKY